MDSVNREKKSGIRLQDGVFLGSRSSTVSWDFCGKNLGVDECFRRSDGPSSSYPNFRPSASVSILFLNPGHLGLRFPKISLFPKAIVQS
jgi:hypothetical protein